MVKRSKKSKSKRVPLKKKYKIIKKVKEHHKKKAKEAKKLGINNKRKVEKDPGIPNDWPFKEQELKALEARRAKALEELEQKKAARKERAQKRKLGLLEDDGASEKEQIFGDGIDGVVSPKIAKIQDNSDRAFYKELAKVIEASDVILEVLDARDPLGTRCFDMEKMVLKSGPNKHLVLLLNKIDLVPREAVEKWLKYLREEFPAVAFKCSTQEQRSNLGWKSTSKASKTSNRLETSDCLGADTLIKLLKNYSRSHEVVSQFIYAAQRFEDVVVAYSKAKEAKRLNGWPHKIIGHMEVEKKISRSEEVHANDVGLITRELEQEVGSDDAIWFILSKMPGYNLTDNEQRIHVPATLVQLIDLIDVGEELCLFMDVAVKEILRLCPTKTLITMYKVPTFDSVDDFLLKVATVRGKLKKGGIVDVEAAARIILHDWNEGKIPYYTMPPSRKRDEHLEEATVVSELGKEFNVEEVYKGESSFIGSLTSVEDLRHIEVPPSCPLTFDEKMLENDIQPEVLVLENEPLKEKNEDNEDQPMGSNEQDSGKTVAKTVNSRQNEQLYMAEGILNTKLRRAEKKKRKKAKSSGTDDMDADYDFKVYYAKRESTMEDVEESGDDEDNQIQSEVPTGGMDE
ncbi:guanine nucleotide-binding protein-like NSN1 [Macadamia integrifolia]|uniref:guanine nucleotide-binding protein-like NSN1 n=1 Tax=Macadamia integrifolia TaxID=60698 RepID=UPI001C4FFCAA|nr:guanine nucleotide-binding protein-like NSN1 [Macadamia integrifolia]